jgi:hypothetical protein
LKTMFWSNTASQWNNKAKLNRHWIGHAGKQWLKNNKKTLHS